MKNRYIKPKAVKQLERLAIAIKQSRHPNFPYPTKTLYRDDTSNGLTKCVIDHIRFHGFQAERINSVGRKVTAGNQERWIKGAGTKGTADLSATIQGRSVKIEIKCVATNDNYQSEYQRAYQRSIESAEGTYLIIRTYTQFAKWWELNYTNGGQN